MMQTAPPVKPSELDTLILTRESLDISEFEVFRVAYTDWYGETPTQTQLEKQFDDYLTSGVLPFYVRHYCRQFVEKRPDRVRIAQLDERRSQFIERLTIVLLVAFVAAALILS